MVSLEGSKARGTRDGEEHWQFSLVTGSLLKLCSYCFENKIHLSPRKGKRLRKCLVQDHNIVKKYLKTSCIHGSMEILKKGLLKINSQVLSVPRNKKKKKKKADTTKSTISVCSYNGSNLLFLLLQPHPAFLSKSTGSFLNIRH